MSRTRDILFLLPAYAFWDFMKIKVLHRLPEFNDMVRTWYGSSPEERNISQHERENQGESSSSSQKVGIGFV